MNFLCGTLDFRIFFIFLSFFIFFIFLSLSFLLKISFFDDNIRVFVTDCAWASGDGDGRGGQQLLDMST